MIAAKDFYLLRTPFLPLDVLEDFNRLSNDELKERLKTFFMDPQLQEAIYIASPELYQEFQKWVQGLLTDKKEVDKLVLSLYRYLIRMCTRATPYGLFAGCATGAFSERTNVSLAPANEHIKHCRLDMNYVAELAATISRLPEVEKQLKFYPNNSLYKLAGRYRYVEFSVKDKFRSYHLTSVECTAHLEKIIESASAGATLNTLIEGIMSNEISREEAESFIRELIENQILVSEMEPTVTGEEFFSSFLNRLSELKNTGQIVEQLTHIDRILKHPSAGIIKYVETHARAKQLIPETSSKDLVQTDLFLRMQQNTISSTVIAELQKQISALWSLSPMHFNPNLQNFKNAFLSRYEEKEIPLLIALDAEAGIGYGGLTNDDAGHLPLINDIVLNKKNEQQIPKSKMLEFQVKKLHECLRENKLEMEITGEDLKALKETDIPTVPDSLYIMGSLLGRSSADIDEGNFQFELSSCGGPSAANLLGRFCHGSKELKSAVKACLEEEESNQPEMIYAEVVHLPQARTGNVLQRPQLRDYEIVYLGNGSVPYENQIPLTDLMVSIRNNSIILRSKKLNKRVIPRLSSAHNFTFGSLPAYQFLGDLQFQHLHTSISWRWIMGAEECFLPRVRYGKIILSKATWNLQRKDFPALNQSANNGNTEIDYRQIFCEIRTRLRLPGQVVLVEGDNTLLLDLDNESCLRILANSISKKERLVLQEFIHNKENCFVNGTTGRHTNEIIIPFKKVQAEKAKKESMPSSKIFPTTTSIPQRSFITGSEWLYVKIYCGSNIAEEVLKQCIKPLIEDLASAKIIDKWYFIRYADPDKHLRIRFHHASDKEFWKQVLENLHSVMKEKIDSGLIYKIQTDTYEREIKRYGANTIQLCEDFFYYDSNTVLNCIDLLEGEEGEEYRWLLAARGVDMLLDDFELNVEAKAALLKILQQSFFKEFGAEKALSDQLNTKYRQHMRLLASFLDQQKDAENGIDEAIALFTMRSLNVRKLHTKLKALKAEDTNTLGSNELIPSFIHMFLNRMLLSDQRKHELVIYHFLSKYYDSQLAISKQQLQNV